MSVGVGLPSSSLPGVNARCGVVPNGADKNAGDCGNRPTRVSLEEVCGESHIRERTHTAGCDKHQAAFQPTNAIPSSKDHGTRLGHTRAAVTYRVRVIGDLEHRTVDVLSVPGEEILDIIPVDTLPAIEAENAADGLEPPQRPKLHPSYWRPTVQSPLLCADPAASCAGDYGLCQCPNWGVWHRQLER